MARNSLSKKVADQAKKSLLSYAIYRPESALVIAMTIIMMGMSALNVPWIPGDWWLWLLFGLTGEALIVLSTLRDEKFYQDIINKMFHQEFDISTFHSPELQKKLAKALEYRELIVKEIEREEDAVLDDYLLNMAHGLEDWIVQLYHLAERLDAYWEDPIIARDMELVPKELEKFNKLLARERQEAVRQELEKTVAAKEAQRDTLKNLRETMTKAQLQLENTISAMGTVYMQVVLLGAKDVESDRAQRLQADMTEQIYALEDISQAMDEVYQMSSQ